MSGGDLAYEITRYSNDNRGRVGSFNGGDAQFLPFAHAYSFSTVCVRLHDSMRQCFCVGITVSDFYDVALLAWCAAVIGCDILYYRSSDFQMSVMRVLPAVSGDCSSAVFAVTENIELCHLDLKVGQSSISIFQ